MKSTQEQIALAMRLTTCRGDSIPNIYRVRNWLISEYGSWLSPTMNEIRAHLGDTPSGFEEADGWISHTSKPARPIKKEKSA